MSAQTYDDSEQEAGKFRLPLVMGSLVLLGLLLISRQNYLLFHSLAELFSIVIACTIFIITWNARKMLNNGYLLFLGISFLFTGGLDLLHTLAYQGMGVFPIASANLPTQLWIAARATQAAALVMAPFFLNRRFSPAAVLAAFAAWTSLLILSIFTWGIFPDSFIEGQGLTPFKIGMEYAIIVGFLFGMIMLVRIRAAFDSEVLYLLLASVALNVVAEFFFTGYVRVTDGLNLLGHFFKIASFYMIYKAVIETGLLKPLDLLFRELAQSEMALRKSEGMVRAHAAELEAIMEAVPAVVWIAHDPQAEVVSGNRVSSDFLRITGPNANHSLTAPEGAAPSHFHVEDTQGNLIAPEDLPLQISARTGQPVRNFEEVVVFNDGTRRYLLGNVTPLLEERGGPSGAVAAFIDITDRVSAQQAMAESERRYRGLFETMTEGLALIELVRGPDGSPQDFRILEINPAMQHMTGLARDEVVGRRAREFFQSDPLSWIERIARVVDTGQPDRFEMPILGLGRYLEMIIYSTGTDRCAALSIDVTEERQSREALRLSEARLRRLVDANIIGLIYAGNEGQVSIANDAFLNLIGYTRDELDRGKINWRGMTPPEHLYKDESGLAEARERGACTPYEKEYIRKDGSRVPILIGYAYFPETESPYICFILDLTQQKQAEADVRAYAERLEWSNRELQDFAFVASHDLQEPLRKILAFSERIKARSQGSLDEEGADYLNRMAAAAQRMSLMINDLLALSRVTTQGQPFQPICLHEIAEEVISDLEMRIERSQGRVELGEMPEIEADPVQIHQLLLNLIGNGLKFHQEGVHPFVRVYSEPEDSGDWIRLIIEDNGIGFEEQYLDRIFQPFQRLHGRNQYEGSGIGLAICRKIAERHGGSITAQSSPGEGARFIVTLPSHQNTRRD